jgi:hypothetical protein
MKVEGYLFLGCAAFFGAADVVYWNVSGDLTGFYLLFTGRRLPKRPEDDLSGDIEQGTGELGFFSPHSWWPLFLGMSAALAAVGFAVGWWLFLLGACFTVLSAIGFVFEYYRGNYAH